MNKTFETKKMSQKERKIFSWSFELNNALLEIIKTHLEWIEQEVALTFIDQ